MKEILPRQNSAFPYPCFSCIALVDSAGKIAGKIRSQIQHKLLALIFHDFFKSFGTNEIDELH
jgi:hypothetical protein